LANYCRAGIKSLRGTENFTRQKEKGRRKAPSGKMLRGKKKKKKKKKKTEKNYSAV
jgi:hypothetical protein